MAQAVAAANTRSPEAMAPFAQGGEVKTRFAWVRDRSTPRWQGGILPVPAAKTGTDASEFLAVFHAWHTCESDGDHVYRVVRAGQSWQLGAEIPETETGGLRIRDHDLHVSLDPPTKTVFIENTFRLERVSSPHPLPFGLFRISPDFQLARLTRENSGGAAVPFRQVGGIVVFALPAEKQFALWTTYKGVVDHEGSDYVRANEATLNSYWYPHIARLPATATVTATAPTDWLPIGQGNQIAEKRSPDGKLTRTFRNDIPTSYFTLGMGKFEVTTRKVNARTYAVYLLRPNPELAQRSLDILEEAMRFCETYFGPYPYQSYTLVQTEGPFGGALEAYSFSTYGPGTLPGAIVHEVAHTWWGGIVPCAYTRSMWNESFANYTEDVLQRIKGRVMPPSWETITRQRRRFLGAFRRVPMVRAHDTSIGEHASVGYGKGALVMRVLEDEIGQETLLRCMATFAAQRPRGEAAEWSDFKAVVQRVTGKDYRWFFAQWAERTGLPVLKLANARVVQEEGAIFVEADIIQIGAPYRLKLPISITLANGETVTDTARVEGARTRIRIPVADMPQQMRLDPQGAIPLAFPADTPENVNPMEHAFP